MAMIDAVEGDPDEEPSLGTGMNGGDDREGDDCELEDDDPAEDDGTLEMSLGSLDHNHSQERWAVGGLRDLEQDHAESGIADLDGLLEQVGTQSWQPGGMV